MNENEQPRYTYDGEPPRYMSDDGPFHYAYDDSPGQIKVRGPSPRLIIGIVIAMVLVIAAVVVAVVLWLNSRQPITAEEFTAVMEGHGFQVNEVDMSWAEEPECYRTVLEATDSVNYQVVYYHMRDSEAALRLYTSAKATIESTAGSVVSYTNVNMGRFGSFTQTSNGLYSCVSYIDDTVISVRTAEECKAEFKEIVKELGY